MRSLMVLLLTGIWMSWAVAGTQDPNWPDGYRLVCELAPDADSSAGSDARVSLKRTSGATRVLKGPEDVAYTVSSSCCAVVFAFDGLRESTDYVCGFEWWDADSQGRRQSVALKPGAGGGWKDVVPSTVPAAFHGDKTTYARILLPIPSEIVKAGGFSVEFANEGGPDAVVGKVWLLERVETETKVRVLILTGDDFKGHLWRKTGPELAGILREDPRFEVTITESPAVLGSPLLNHYDVVVIHFKNYAERLPLGGPVWTGLREYVAGGGGLVSAHFGCGAFQEWDAFEEIIGRVWNPKFRAHDKYGPFRVSVVDADHPITNGLDDFDTEDELYTCLDGQTSIRVLCDAVSKKDGKTYPMGFVVEGGTGRVFNCTLGHDVNAFKASGTRALYRRAVAWAAGMSVRR